jgi:hypothetical protein
VSGSDRILTAPRSGAGAAAPPASTTTGPTATTPVGPARLGGHDRAGDLGRPASRRPGRPPTGCSGPSASPTGARRVGFIVHRATSRTPGPTCSSTSIASSTPAGPATRPGSCRAAPPSSPSAPTCAPRAAATSRPSGRTGWPATCCCGTSGSRCPARSTPCTTPRPATSPSPRSAVTGGAASASRSIPTVRPPPSWPASRTSPARPPCASTPRPSTWCPTLLRRQSPCRCAAPTASCSTPPACSSPACSTTSTPPTPPLGVHRAGDAPVLSVWAPTADVVRLHLFDGDAAPSCRWGGEHDHRRLAHRRHPRLVGPRLPLRGRGLRPHHRAASSQPRHRPVQPLAADELGPLADRRPRRSRPQARGLGRAREAAAGRPRRRGDLRAPRARLQRRRRHRARGRCAAPTPPSAWRAAPASPPDGARRGRAHPPAPAAHLRHRHDRRGPRPWQRARPCPTCRCRRARTPSSGRRERARPRRLQLGLRPLALPRARGLLRHRPRRPGPGARVPRAGHGARRDRPAGDRGRGVQPHERRRSEPTLGARPHRPGYYHRLDAAGRVTRAPAARTPPPSTR